MKRSIIVSVSLLAVLLGACRRQEAVPMKLGMDVPASTVTSK